MFISPSESNETMTQYPPKEGWEYFQVFQAQARALRLIPALNHDYQISPHADPVFLAQETNNTFQLVFRVSSQNSVRFNIFTAVS